MKSFNLRPDNNRIVTYFHLLDRNNNGIITNERMIEWLGELFSGDEFTKEFEMHDLDRTVQARLEQRRHG